MHRFNTGIWLGVGAYVIWGLTPIFWNLVDDVGAAEILAHRVLWSVPILMVAISLRRGWPRFREAYSSRRTVVLALLGGLLIGINWGVFLWAVLAERIVEASLGYFINPLVSVALGVLVLREQLRPAQRVAVVVAAIGVTGMTVMLGVLPWVSLTLAFSFGLYGLLKKTPGAAPALDGLLGEVSAVAIPGAIFLGFLAADGRASFASSVPTAAWFVVAGLVTVVPLWMFGAGAQRIPLSTIGLLQYIAQPCNCSSVS